MKKELIISSILAAGATFTGCTSDYGYHSTRGVAKGAIVGSVLGGVIGHQSDETEKGAALGALLGGIVGNEIGQRQDQRAREYERSKRAAITSRSYGSRGYSSRGYGRNTEDPGVLNARHRAEAAEYEVDYIRKQQEAAIRREEQIRDYNERARIANEELGGF